LQGRCGERWLRTAFDVFALNLGNSVAAAFDFFLCNLGSVFIAKGKFIKLFAIKMGEAG